MSPFTSQASADAPRRAARDVIEAVLENMRRNLEPLKYSTLVPNRFVVYLHPQEFARLEGILPVLQQQTVRALGEELAKLNRKRLAGYLKRFLGEPTPVENPGGSWQVEILPDPDGDLAEGDILVQSDLALPHREEPGAGQRTRRITTVFNGSRTTKREERIHAETGPSTVYARLRWEDDSGPRTFEITRDLVSIGRGGVACPVDVRIDAAVDVSREHLRLRRDPLSGGFTVVDVSTLGSTLDGRPLPKGYDVVDGEKRENGVATPLGARARIGLADVVYLEFETVAPRS